MELIFKKPLSKNYTNMPLLCLVMFTLVKIELGICKNCLTDAL